MQPAHGSFVATRLSELLKSGEVSTEVIAPIPWLPPGGFFPEKGRLDKVPRTRDTANFRVHHPKYLVIPKLGMNFAPRLLYHSLKRTVLPLLKQGKRFDIIDAHYFYPDGVAALRLSRELGIPVTITARGTDINLIPRFDRPRSMIIDACRKADGVIAVCQALRLRMQELVAEPSFDVRVLRNGVDLELFRPLDRIELRQRLGFKRRTIGSVGLLIERKGHHLVIEALRNLPDTDLVVVGAGPWRARLERLAEQCGVADRVRFFGVLDQRQLSEVYNALDALVLASSREGWANVLLEAMACGTPVAASAVWGTPEVVAAPEAGVLMSSLDSGGVLNAVQRLFSAYPDRAATRRYAERFSWESTTQGQLDLFREILARQTKSAA